MFDESSFYYTERPLDFALPNEGFFAVEDRYGDINYTRDGAFAMTQADTGEWYLVSGSGEYVLDYDNNRIVVPFSEDGTAPDYDTLRDMVGVFRFDNVYGIDAAGGPTVTRLPKEAVRLRLSVPLTSSRAPLLLQTSALQTRW